MAIPNRLGNY